MQIRQANGRGATAVNAPAACTDIAAASRVGLITAIRTNSVRHDLLGLIFFLLVLSPSLHAAFPTARGYVTDAAGVLDEPTRRDIEALLRSVQHDTSAEIALVTVGSLDGMTVEEYANRLFAAWGIGQKGKDNGVLVLVAPTDRKIRIEVGYGLEPILPDGLAGSIIRADCLPKFRNGDYSDGIRAGVTHVADVVRRSHVLTSEERRQLAEAGRPPAYLMTPFFAAFVTLGAFIAGAGLSTKTGFPLLWGAVFGGIPLGMALVPFFNASVIILVVLALAFAVWGYRRGPSAKWIRDMRHRAARHGSVQRTSGWVMGGGSGSGSSSSGVSFGGGSSGGGGASGSW